MKIYPIDCQHQGLAQVIASYLIVGSEGPLLIETGPEATLQNMLAGLAEHGYQPSDIKNVLLTHIHFDHAGAAGWWAQQGAHIYVHHVGAKHIIDPSRLVASATRIYGDHMDTLWGKMIPAPAENVTAVYDNDIIQAGGLTFIALDTPGHANHHHVYKVEDVAFTGDAVGMRMFGQTLLELPAPPPEFNREVWHNTLDRLEAEQFTTLFPTHYGAIKQPSEHIPRFRQLIDDSTQVVKQFMDDGLTRDEILANYTVWNNARLRNDGAPIDRLAEYEVANPLHMSVDGILRYWRKKAEKEQ